MSNKILCYSDQHLRDCGSFYPYNRIDTNGLTLELNNMIKGWEFVRDQILEHKPKIVINCGDIVQYTELQTAQVLHAMYLCFKMIRESCMDVGARHILFPGNHDILSESQGITNIGLCEAWVDDYITSATVTTYNNINISFIPYTSSHKYFCEHVEKANESSDLLLCHADFAGCTYESGMKSLSSLAPEVKIPCISGDIHLPQDFDNIHYVGSLVQHRFGQNNIDRAGGILLYDIETKEISRVVNNYSKHYVKLTDKDLPLEDKSLLDKCVFQIVTSRTLEEIDTMFKGYDYMYVPEIRSQSGSVNNYSSFSMADPLEVLRDHIANERPEAIFTYDQIFNNSEVTQ